MSKPAEPPAVPTPSPSKALWWIVGLLVALLVLGYLILVEVGHISTNLRAMRSG